MSPAVTVLVGFFPLDERQLRGAAALCSPPNNTEEAEVNPGHSAEVGRGRLQMQIKSKAAETQVLDRPG